VLSHLTPEQSAAIITHLPSEDVVQVGFRLGMMDRVTADALQAVEDGLKQRFSAVLENKFLDATGGIDSLVELLMLADKPVEDVIMGGIAEVDAELAKEIRAKMFVFADLQLLDDRQMQLVLRSVDAARLPLALKGVADVVSDKVLGNLSSRARENLIDEISLLGSVRMTDVEEAQNEILDSVRELEESGELIINRGGNDFVN
jgi:flagellar motor switch protein FliG